MSLRIAVVTPLFPFRDEPYRGIPIYNTVIELQKLATVEVFCPVAMYPAWKRLQPSSYIYRRLDQDYQPPGVKTTYTGYRALPLFSRGINGWTCSRRLRPLLRKFRPDLILAYWLGPEGRAALLAGRKLGVPVVGGARGSDLHRPPDRVSRYLLMRTLRGMDGLLTVSDDLRRLATGWGVPAGRARTVPNGCNTETFRPRDRQEARRRLSLEPDAELVVYVGRLVPSKGLGELTESFVELAERRPRLQLVCIGEGSWQAEWSERLSARGLTGRLLLPGGCAPKQVAEWMTASDVVCLPSYSEGCPNVVIEALAAGRPVVATAVGGSPDLVDSRCGILVPPKDAGKLAEALADVLDRQWDARTIAAEFRRGWDDVARETLEFCRQTANRND